QRGGNTEFAQPSPDQSAIRDRFDTSASCALADLQSLAQSDRRAADGVVRPALHADALLVADDLIDRRARLPAVVAATQTWQLLLPDLQLRAALPVLASLQQAATQQPLLAVLLLLLAHP